MALRRLIAAVFLGAAGTWAWIVLEEHILSLPLWLQWGTPAVLAAIGCAFLWPEIRRTWSAVASCIYDRDVQLVSIDGHAQSSFASVRRGDLAAPVIENSGKFAVAVAAFNNCRWDTDPRRVDLAWDAMVQRLNAEGKTEETMEFLRGENLVNFSLAESPPPHA